MSVKTRIHDSVSLEMPFSLTSVTKLTISHFLNDHSKAWIEGAISDKDVDICSNFNSKEAVTIRYEDEGTSQVLFSGIPCFVEVKHEGECSVRLELSSRTILLDQEKRRRSFQRKNKTYQAIFKEVIKENGGDMIGDLLSSGCYEAPLMQYDETDWEFIKRVSSYIGVPVYPGDTGINPQVYVGLKNNYISLDHNLKNKITKRVREFREFKKESSMESDFLSFYINGGWECCLGDKVSCEGRDFCVAGIEDIFDKGLLSRRCLLKVIEGVYTIKKYNNQIKGVSLFGTITAVKSDRVRVRLYMDQVSPGEKLHWYPWHRNDWFCMPEKGGKASLYIPESDESQAYVIGLKQDSGKKKINKENPETKHFITKRGKGMEFTPHALSFRAAGNKINIQLSDRAGVNIRSSRGIKIEAGQSLMLTANRVNVKSKERIVFATDSASIIVDDPLQIKG